jgi:thymidylate synthase (FAD)
LAKHNHFTPFCHARVDGILETNEEFIDTLLETPELYAGLALKKIGKNIYWVNGSLYALMKLSATGLEELEGLFPFSYEALKNNTTQTFNAGSFKILTDSKLEIWHDSFKDEKFRMIYKTIHVKAPIFVARQLVKHQVSLVWNEVSRRYVDDAIEYFYPDVWRGKASNKKQGSSDEVINVDNDYINSFLNSVAVLYNKLLEDNVAPELARIVTPLNSITEWYWTGSLTAFKRVCNLRLDSHTQLETQVIAQQIQSEIKRLYSEF